MFERFTDDSRQVVVYAQEECRLLGHDHIGTEHLLLALMHDEDATADVLRAAGVTRNAVRDLLTSSPSYTPLPGSLRGTPKESSGHIPFTPRVKHALESSLRAAQRLGQDHIARPHVLRGLLEVHDSVGVRLLVDLGVDLEDLAAHADGLALASKPGVRHRTEPSAATTTGSAEVGARPRQVRPEDLAALVDQLAHDRDRLEQGLRRYGRHDESCDPAAGCSCGLTALLESVRPGNDEE